MKKSKFSRYRSPRRCGRWEAGAPDSLVASVWDCEAT